MSNCALPVLTVATVTRNCVGTIGATISSVAAAKRPDIEYVVIDGASTDGTLEQLQMASGVIDRLVSEPDTGIYNAMNKAVGLARGDYVLFINGDDEVLPSGFGDVMTALATWKADIVCATTLVGSVEQPQERLIAEPWKLLFFNSIPHPSAFTATKLLKRFPFREDLRIASDYDFFLRCLLARARFARVEAPTALHRRGGESGNVERSAAEVERVRHERLGSWYPFVNGIQQARRAARGTLAWRRHG